LSKLQTFSHVQRAPEYAISGAFKGSAAKLPVLITMHVNVDDALEIFRARSGQALGTSKSRIKQSRSTTGRIALTVLTDTDSIKAANGSLSKIARDRATGTGKMGPAATTGAIAGAAGPRQLSPRRHYCAFIRSRLAWGANPPI
jgi:hypothetical protein